MMGSSCETVENNGGPSNGLHFIRHTAFQSSSKLSPSWFDLRVFYVRVSNLNVDDSTPEFLTLNHIPLNPDTLLEVNGLRCGVHSDGISSSLRRDRLDKKSEEATFVCTDSIRFTGSVKFEVFNKEDLVLTGVLEMLNSNGFTGESNDSVKRWILSCDSEMGVGTALLKGKRNGKSEYAIPMIEVYVAGCYSGDPIILSKTLQLTSRKKQNRKCTLDAIPEFMTNGTHNDTDAESDAPSDLDLQVAEYRDYKPEIQEPLNMYWTRPNYMDGEDGELSWFNAGVRVGVGIGLGVCVGVGIGIGLLVRTYQTTTRTFRRRLF